MIQKSVIYLIVILVLVLLFVYVGRISYEAPPRSSFVEEGDSAFKGFSADSWGIFDIQTGSVLLGKDIDAVKPIASISKLFTAYAAIESEYIDSIVTIGWSDLNTEGRAGKLTYGEQLTVRELLFPLLIESSNDAGEAIKRTLGKDFDAQIGALKEQLSLKSTTIHDGSGLSEKNLSTVSDLAIFYAFIYQNNQHLLDITQLEIYIGEDRGWVNNDPASKYATFSGGKNGFTYEAGKTFLGAFQTPSTDSDLGLVLLGSKDLVSDLKLFMEYVERAY